MKEYFKTALAGMLIGVANTIPGVSGGTMAVILNIYDKILNAVSLKNIRENLGFLISLAIGGGIGILAFSNVIILLLENYPLILNFVFIGLIIGSLPIIYTHATECSLGKASDKNLEKPIVSNAREAAEKKKVSPISYAFALATFSFMIYLTIVQSTTVTNQTLAEMGGITTSLLIYLFFSSFVSSIAMLLPGISGSLILLLFGVYAVIIESIGTLNFVVLLPVAFGVGLGILVGIKLIRELINRFPQPIYFAILGLMIGSIFTIWPGFEFSFEGIFAIVLAIIFGIISYLSSKGK